MTDEKTTAPKEAPAKRDEPRPHEAEDQDLDLDVEELDDGDRLKEGFTGQER